jgi:hypothetical protein
MAKFFTTGFISIILLIYPMSVYADTQIPQEPLNVQLDNILKKDFLELDLNKKDKISNLCSFVYNNKPENIFPLWSRVVNYVYNKNITQLDKQAFIEIVFKKDFKRQGFLTDKKVYDGFIKIMKDDNSNDNVINEALRFHNLFLQNANNFDMTMVQNHFTLIRGVSDNKNRAGFVRKNAFRELGTVPLEENLPSLLSGISENDTTILEGIGSGLKRFLINYESWDAVTIDNKKANKNLISKTILSYFKNNPPNKYQQMFLYLPLGKTGTIEAKVWLIEQLRKTEYKNYQFVLPALNNMLDKNEIKEVLDAYSEHKIENSGIGASVVSQSIKENFNSYKIIEFDSSSSSKIAYLNGVVLFNRIGESKADPEHLLTLLHDKNPDVREKAVLAIRLNVANHYDILSKWELNENNQKVKNMLHLYGYHMNHKEKK